jgi:hypothetical protein
MTETQATQVWVYVATHADQLRQRLVRHAGADTIPSLQGRAGIVLGAPQSIRYGRGVQQHRHRTRSFRQRIVPHVTNRR